MPPTEHSDLVVRPAVPSEHQTCAEVYFAARSQAEADGTMPPGRHSDAETRVWWRDVVLETREVWLAQAVDDAGAVGVLVLDTAWLDSLYVVPSWWRHGVASTLLSLARALRPDGFSLWVFAVNAPARRLYERHGLVEVHRSDGRDNEEGAPEVAYAWRPDRPVGAELSTPW